MTLETPPYADENPSCARSQIMDSAEQVAHTVRAFLISRRRSVQSALAFTLFPITTIAETHMNTSTATLASDATVVAANAPAVRDDGMGAAIRPFKYRATDAELSE